MSQNSMRYSWSAEEVDEKLKGIMSNIFHNSVKAANEYGMGRCRLRFVHFDGHPGVLGEGQMCQG